MTHMKGVAYTENLPAADERSLIDVELAVPELASRDLLVEVRAVSVNPVDVKLRAGAATGQPRVLGFDAAGVVRAVGDQVHLFTPGDEVFYAGAIDRPGTNSDLHAVDERLVGPKPTTLDFAAAAAVPLTALTAWEGLFDKLRLSAEATGTMLVVGGSGGVGSMVLQLARELVPGLMLVSTSSRAETEKWVRGLGAHEVVDHTGDLVEQVAAVAPEGLDYIFTSYSVGQVETYASLLAPFGQVVAIDDPTEAHVGPLKSKSASWHWEFMFARSLHATADMAHQHEILSAVARLIDEGRARSTATTVLAPIDASTLRAAHAQVETGRVIGKVVLTR